MTAGAHRAVQRLALLVALLAVLSCLVATPGDARERAGAADAAGTDWRVLLGRAAGAIRTTAFTGEAISVTWLDGQERVHRSSVRNDPAGELVLGSDDGTTVLIGQGGAGLLDSQGGWFLAVPVDTDDPREAFTALEAKYRVTALSPEQVLHRSCVLLEIHRRSDGSLRERLWIDEQTGLLLRRETYDGGRSPVRVAAYLSLDFAPSGFGGDMGPPVATPAQLRRQDALPVGPQGLEALRAAGWTVPEALPGGYQHMKVYALSSGEAQPLQAMYSDGLYHVSVFQQHGGIDWASLRPGAQRAADLDWVAYHWPGSVPSAFVWEAAGRVYAVVGDAPAGDLHAIAQALPRPQPPPLGRRLTRGLRRLWSWVSPWS
ncbi:MAG: sigma-E factor regulatory protein RseB domain-containing protein [Egibacteraceae bacterium]